MKWGKTIGNIADCKPIGECPFCGSPDVDYKATQVSEKRGYMDVWCNACKSWLHVSRMAITDNFKYYKTTGNLPEGLILRNE